MHTLAVTLLSLALLAQTAAAAPGRVVSLSLPRALGEGEVAWLEVKVGVIPRGAEVEVTTLDGRTLGVISPYGIRPGRPAGTYTVPLPPDLFSDGRVKLRLTLSFGRERRAPTAKEVKAVRLRLGIGDGRVSPSDTRRRGSLSARSPTSASRHASATRNAGGAGRRASS